MIFRLVDSSFLETSAFDLNRNVGHILASKLDKRELGIKLS